MKQKGYVYEDKRENCWYARLTITDTNGKRRNLKKRASSEAEARKKLRILTQQIEEEGSKGVDFAKLTFNYLADYYERHYLKPAEYVEGRKISGLRDVERPRGFLPHFRAYFGKRKLREITYGDIYTYRSLRLQTPTKYKRPRSIADWNREAAVLRRMLNIALREGWILKNPFNAGEPLIVVSFERRRERILTVDEERRLLDACDSHPYRKHLKSLLVFLVDTGCRKSEALKLCWRSVCFASRVITIEGMTTKTLKTRQVAMTARLYQELVALWEASNKEPDKPVFSVTDNVRKSFASACGIAGIKHGGIDGLTLHSLRHTAATRLVRGNLPLQMVGRILGHSQPQTTYRYLSANVETAIQAATILESFQLASSELIH